MKKRRYRRLVETNELKYRNLCEECLVFFDSSRPDSKYCDNKCKCAAAYARKKAAEAERTATRKHAKFGNRK